MVTVESLRKTLDDIEKKWSEKDKHYLGEFKDQGIYVDAFHEDGKYGGISRAKDPYYDAQFGILIFGERVKGVKIIKLGRQEVNKV